MRSRALFISSALFLAMAVACGGARRGRHGKVPAQAALPPLPEFMEMCVSKAVSLPGKTNGKAWDGVGKALRRKQLKLLPALASAGQMGGYAAAVAAAGGIGAKIFTKVNGPPDLRVRVQLGRQFIIKTATVKNTPIAAFEASEANCAVLKKKEYTERVQFIVEDFDVGRPDTVGSTSFVGIPVDALQSGKWMVHGFDQVIEIEVTLQPMEKDRPRQQLAPDPEPPAENGQAAPPPAPTPEVEPRPETNVQPREPDVKEVFVDTP